MNAATLFDIPDAIASHPAKYTDVLLPTMAALLKGSKRILDPFGGTGKVFALNNWLPDVQIDAIEIEAGFIRHPRTTLGNALHLPWPDGTFDAICTSPTYGNRMADEIFDNEKYTYMTYTAKLKKELQPDNSGRLQWGNEYMAFHAKAWTEARRVLADSGVFVLNIKDHIRDGKLMEVTHWHITCLTDLGFRMIEQRRISTPSMTRGQNGNLRVPYESVIKFEKVTA